MWGARLRRFLFVGGPLVLLVFLTWFLLPARKLPPEPYKSQARATHADYDPPQAAVVPAAVQMPVQAQAAPSPFAQAVRRVPGRRTSIGP